MQEKRKKIVTDWAVVMAVVAIVLNIIAYLDKIVLFGRYALSYLNL